MMESLQEIIKSVNFISVKYTKEHGIQQSVPYRYSGFCEFLLVHHLGCMYFPDRKLKLYKFENHELH